MSLVKSQLLQRIRVVGATAVTFFVVSGAAAHPLELQDVPSAARQEPPSLTLISPLDGLWDQLETVEPASDDLLTRLRCVAACRSSSHYCRLLKARMTRSPIRMAVPLVCGR